MEIEKIIKERYSVRKYKDEKVSDEVIAKILDSALHAPTAKNLQPFHIYVLKSEEAMEKIKSVCKCIFGAPNCFIVTYDFSESWENPYTPEYHSGEMDASIVTDEMMLTAWSLGVGTCWVGMFDYHKIAETFNIPDNERVAVVMPFGYPSEESKPIAMHDQSKELSALVTEL
ncbi:MAG: nitroreductase family protein [Eubacterium sp.]|nr:nitroreductase family protein [Eubacterium sp.]